MSDQKIKQYDNPSRDLVSFWERCVLACVYNGIPIKVADELAEEWEKRFGSDQGLGGRF